MLSKIETITGGKAAQIYSKILDPLDYTTPHEFIATAWAEYEKQPLKNPSTNGRIFEYLVCETLVLQGLLPFYYQAKLTFVPNCEFDIVLFDLKRPVVLSVKVSLRERYKQAALEGIALGQVYRKAEQYLITMSADEAKANRLKIDSGEITGLNDIIVANTKDYDQLLGSLKQRKFVAAAPIVPINGRLLPK